ncbi:MAG: polysaccharide biosynthesis C-terminal domain-containing protein, partial [Desulfobacterales bacterium]|nr:polysaccharide biosynthesis C-terminal domain-containing protein [Desulfobacterales bacterium]
SDALILLLFGEEYHLSARVLRIHIWAGIFVFFNNTVWTWYLAKNKQQLANYRIMTGLVLNITLNYWLIPRYGIVGAAWATLVSRCFVAYIGQLFSSETAVLFVMMNKAIWFGSILNVWKELISSIQKNTGP